MKTFKRDMKNAKVFGICSGLSNYFDADVNLIRFFVAIAIFCTAGTGALAYLIAWIIFPKED